METAAFPGAGYFGVDRRITSIFDPPVGSGKYSDHQSRLDGTRDKGPNAGWTI